MRFVIVAIFVAMLCAACGTISPFKLASPSVMKLKRDAESWVGRTLDDLIITNGEPFNIYQIEAGGRMVEYLSLASSSQIPAATSGEENPPRLRRGEVALPSSGLDEIRLDDQRILRGVEEESKRFVKRHKTKASEDAKCKFLFKISASDMVESWSLEGEHCD